MQSSATNTLHNQVNPDPTTTADYDAISSFVYGKGFDSCKTRSYREIGALLLHSVRDYFMIVWYTETEMSCCYSDYQPRYLRPNPQIIPSIFDPIAAIRKVPPHRVD